MTAMRRITARPFSKRERAILVAELREGRGIEDIAVKLRRTPEQVRRLIAGMQDEVRLRREATERRSRIGEHKAPAAQRGNRTHATNPGGPTPPAAALIDRERREAAKEKLDLTGQLMGDPPPGYSALDALARRRSEAEAASGQRVNSIVRAPDPRPETGSSAHARMRRGTATALDGDSAVSHRSEHAR